VLTPGMVPPWTAEMLAAESSADAVETDQDGRFEMAGLAAREYALFAWEPRTGASIHSGSIAAGAVDVALRLEEDAVLDLLTGRVTAPDGLPLEGLRVDVRVLRQATETGASWIDGPTTLTAEDGSFALAQVPRRHSRLSVTGEAILPAELSLEGLGEGNAAHVVAVRRCHFRIAASGPTPPTHVELLDVNGAPQSIHAFEASSWMTRSRWTLEGGSSPALSAGEGPAVVLFLRDGKEVARKAIELVAGEILVVAP